MKRPYHALKRPYHAMILCTFCAKLHFSYRTFAIILHFSYRTFAMILHFSYRTFAVTQHFSYRTCFFSRFIWCSHFINIAITDKSITSVSNINNDTFKVIICDRFNRFGMRRISCITKRGGAKSFTSYSWKLGYSDSNQEWQDQNL